MDYVKGFVPKGGTKVNIVRFLMQLHSVHGDRQQNTFVVKIQNYCQWLNDSGYNADFF